MKEATQWKCELDDCVFEHDENTPTPPVTDEQRQAIMQLRLAAMKCGKLGMAVHGVVDLKDSMLRVLFTHSPRPCHTANDFSAVHWLHHIHKASIEGSNHARALIKMAELQPVDRTDEASGRE